MAAVNDALADAPETINSDPYGEGWLVEISVTGDGGDPTGALLDAAAYQALVDGVPDRARRRPLRSRRRPAITMLAAGHGESGDQPASDGPAPCTSG